MNEARTRALLFLLALGFVAVGALFIPRFGIEVDEALVTNGIYPRGGPMYSLRIGSAELPLMMMSYLGALKTWMYNSVFLTWAPSPMSLRLPTLLLGAVSLILFFALLDTTLSRSAAWIGTVLLATDPSYLLMNTIDFGPVTIQFVFKLWALLLLVWFHRSRQRGMLAGAFFLFGLAMWDKAIFAWALAGLALGAVVAFPTELRKHLSLKNVAVATAAGIAGALPLIVYNIMRPLETLRANAAPESLAVWGKSIVLWHTIDGSILSGFLTMRDPGPMPGLPARWYQSLSVAVSHALGQPGQTGTLLACGIAVLSLAFLWRSPARKPMLFALAVCVGTWLPMVLTAGAGAAAHHVLLLWPFHLLLIAAALDQVKFRTAAAGIAALLSLSNLAVVNQYYADAIVNGPTLRWTDAMDPLHRWLANAHVSGDASRIYVADWGIMETMVLLSEGKLPVEYPDFAHEEHFRAALSQPGAIFVAHPREAMMHPQERAALEALAAREHYTEEPVALLRDRNGRPAFDVFRFRKLPL